MISPHPVPGRPGQPLAPNDAGGLSMTLVVFLLLLHILLQQKNTMVQVGQQVVVYPQQLMDWLEQELKQQL